MRNNNSMLYHSFREEFTLVGDKQKEQIWETVLKMIEIIQTVRKEGLLCLENIAGREEDVFLRSCLRYIMEVDLSREELCEYVSIWLVTADVSVVRRLEMAVIGDGLEQLLLQRTPSAALHRLGAWLGTEFADRVDATLAAMNHVQRKSRTESLEPEFERMLTLSEEQLCALMERADINLPALALMGASDAVIERVRNAVSVERWEQLEDRMQVMAYPRACDVRKVQRELLERM